MAQCYARDAAGGTLEDTIARLRAYREHAGVDWVQFSYRIRSRKSERRGLR